MARDLPDRIRRFSDKEVALIIKRAAELQAAGGEEDASGMSLAEVEQVANEAGIDPFLVRRAASDYARQPATPEPSVVRRAPSAVSLETVVSGEVLEDDYEMIVDEVRRSFGAPQPGSRRRHLSKRSRDCVCDRT